MKSKTNKKMMILSAIGIIMIVIGHTGAPIDLGRTMFPFYSFHIVLFVFISGYFYKKENENNLFNKNGYIVRQIKSLLVPYFIWNLIYGILGMILRHCGLIKFGSGINFATFFIEPWRTGHQYIFNLAAWFVLALFLVKITYPIFRKALSKINIWNDIVMLLFFLILAFSCALFAKQNNRALLPFIRTGFLLLFYHLGYFYKEKIEGKYEVNTLIYFIAIIIMQLVILKLNKDIAYYVWKMQFPPHIITPILSSFTGIFFWVKVAELVEPLLGKSKIVNYIGNNTSSIMYHHLFFCFILNTFIYLVSNPLKLTSFNISQYKSNIYYSYTSGLPQARIIYFSIGLGGPLIIKYIYEKIKKHKNDVNKSTTNNKEKTVEKDLISHI